MSSIFTKDFKSKLIQDFIADVANTNSASSKYYVALGRTDEWPVENSPTTATSDLQSYSYQLFNNMLAGKRVASSDVSFMIENYTWIGNTVYDFYSHLDADLQNKQFFVITSSRRIYKCLFNNYGKPSTIEPTSTSTTGIYQTSDGYLWKYMGQISKVTYDKFTTVDYVPAVIDTDVKSAAINGSLDVIVVSNNGNNYVNIINQGVIEQVVNTKTYKIANSGSSSADSYYNNSAFYISAGPGINQLTTINSYQVNTSGKYVTTDNALSSITGQSKFTIAPQVVITGDGVSASAYAVVNTSTYTVSSIQVVNRGSKYTFATASIVANSLYGSDATAYPIISPPYGHGFDILTELGCDTLGISVDFDSSVNTIPYFIDYRQVGLLYNPLIYGKLPGTGTANVYSSNTFVQQLQIQLNSARTSGTFTIEETVKGSVSKATGIVKYANTSYLMVANTTGSFVVNESISGLTSTALGTISELNNIDLQPNSGKVLYYKNIQNIQRTETSKETVKLYIKF